MKKYLPWGIRIVIAGLFLLSGIAKLYPSMLMALGTFEAKQLIPMGFSEQVAPYFSRFLIGAELAIGVAILQTHFLKRFVVPVAMLLLVVFCVQLSFYIAANGPNGGNCGCFGTLLPMTPLEALIKNIVALGLLAYLYKLLLKDGFKQRFSNLLVIFLSISLFLFAFAPIQLSNLKTTTNTPSINSDFSIPDFDSIVPMQSDSKDMDQVKVVSEKTGKVDDKVDENSKKETAAISGPIKVISKFSSYLSYIPSEVKIDEGKKILCLFAPGCEHCRETAKQLTEMRTQMKDFPPVHIVFMDEEAELIPDFFKFAGRTYSYRVAPVVDFWKVLDSSKDTPGVVYLWNGNIRYFADGIEEKAFDRKRLKEELLKGK